MSASQDITKVCTKCGRELPATLEFFHAHSLGKNGLNPNCKVCRADHARRYGPEYREQNREVLNAKNRAWRENNRERVAAYNKAYWAAHPELSTKYAGRYAERIAAYNREYAKTHREYFARHARVTGPKRRAAKLGNGGSHTIEDIQVQYDRQNGCCFYCHKKVGGKYHVDHVIPIALGGSDDPENLVIACPKCNISKGAKHPQDFCGRLL